MTLTTVGYGDVYPITVTGKLIASAIAILGIGIVALPAGIIAANFSKIMKIPMINEAYCVGSSLFRMLEKYKLRRFDPAYGRPITIVLE